MANKKSSKKKSSRSLSTEEALRESEEKWKSLTENSDDFIMLINNKGLIKYINRTFPNETPKDVIGKTIFNYIAKEHHDLAKNTLIRVFKTGKTESFKTYLNV